MDLFYITALIVTEKSKTKFVWTTQFDHFFDSSSQPLSPTKVDKGSRTLCGRGQEDRGQKSRKNCGRHLWSFPKFIEND